MSPRPATISAADLSRLIRAAKKEGAQAVKLVLKTGEVAEFVLGDSGISVEKPKAKVANKVRTLL